jgi:hypothetical protein
MTAFIVFFCIFFTHLAVGDGFGEDILDRKSRRGREASAIFFNGL